MSPTPGSAPSELLTAPSELLNSEAYLRSLKDARSVYIDGEKVPDVTVHPTFRNASRSIARLYAALHDSRYRDTLTAIDAGGQRTHKFFKPSYSAAELLE